MTSVINSGIGQRKNGTPPREVPLADINLGDLSFWAAGDEFRDGAFTTLRREAPIKFFEVPTISGFPGGTGHWALTKHEHVHFASRHPELFSSEPTSVGLADVPAEVAEYTGSFISLDDPRHQRLRGIVSRGFTPRVVGRIEQSVHDRARQLVDAMVADHPDGRADFVESVAGPLPLQIICDMMGIPPEDEAKIFHWSNVILCGGDIELLPTPEAFLDAVFGMAKYGEQLAEARRADPQEDLTTALVRAEVDGDRLTDTEIGSFFMLLVVAGNETTRNAISHGITALTRYPEQRALLWADYEKYATTATEEIVRWSTPLMFMRRRLTADLELGGVPMRAGDKVSMWYISANRDEAVFADPWMFDITRNPNPHYGFGGGGVHFCLGANLARREIRVAFEELRNRVPDIAATAEPDLLHSPFAHGIKRLPVAWTP